MFSGNQVVLVFQKSFIKDYIIIITNSSKTKGYAFTYVGYIFLRITEGRCGVDKTASRFSKYVNSNVTFNYFKFSIKKSEVCVTYNFHRKVDLICFIHRIKIS